MNNFLATLARLSSGFAEDVVVAVRRTPGDELYRALGKTPPAPPAPAPAPVVVKRPAAAAARKSPPAAAPKKSAPPSPIAEPKTAKKPVEPKKAQEPKKAAPSGPLTASAVASVRRFFEESGRRGATAQQVQRHLELDESDARIPSLLHEMMRDGVIRDAGFRRTTGNGTQPVLVIA